MIPRGVVRFDLARGIVTLPNSDPITVAVKPRIQVEHKPKPIQVKGPELWRELHSKQDPTPEWFEFWLSKIPAYGCSCRNHAKTYIAENPVDYENFSRWACDFHNSVNVRLGKPIWPLQSDTTLQRIGLS